MSWLEDIDIQFQNNDMLSMEVDAIVVTINIRLEAYGKISQKVFHLGKDHLSDDLIALKAGIVNQRLDLGQAVSLDNRSVYNIGGFQRLIFVALWDIQSEYSINLFYKAYLSSLREAFKQNMTSIVLPVMAYNGNLKLCGQSIKQVIHDLNNLKNSSEFSIEEIYFISSNSMHIDYLRNEIEPYLL